MKFSIVEGGLVVLGCELGSFRGWMMSGMVDSFFGGFTFILGFWYKLMSLKIFIRINNLQKFRIIYLFLLFFT